MKIIDISIPIHEGMPTYMDNENNQPEIVTKTSGYITDTTLKMNIHTSTHIDAPLHMLNDGETIESIELEKLIRKCKVIDLVHVNDRITAEDLQDKDIQPDDFLLFKTKNSSGETSNTEFIFLAEDGATFLVEKKIAGVGIDTLGIERSQENHPTHKSLFSNNIIIIEGLNLKDVAPSNYFMIAAPLKLTKTEAAPARVLLIEGM